MPLIHKFKLILSLMAPEDRRKLVLIFFVSVLNGLLSVVGIASILPFIGLISQPELMETNRYILAFKEFSGLETYGGVVTALGVCSLGLILFGNLVSAFDNFYGEIFGFRKEHVLTRRLLRNYLQTDVLAFSKRKTSERAKEVLSEVDRVILDTLSSIFELFSGIILTLFVVGLLLWVNWSVTVIVSVTLVGVHLFIHHFTSVRLEVLGKDFAELETALYGDVLDALNLQREIKLNGVTDFFIKRYSGTFRKMEHNRIRHAVIDMFPQYLLESLAYGVILSVAVYFAVFSDSGTAPITLVGMYAFAAYRLMPAVAGIFNSVEVIWFGSAILDDFVKAFDEPAVSNSAAAVPAPQQTLGLSEVSFRYAPDGAFHLDDLSLEFEVGAMTCIRGKTGCGKSTILNLMAGLYHPEKGCVLVDGQPADAYDSEAWKRRVGFVPPAVNVMQASIYANIALGVPEAEVDSARVEEVARIVELDEHIQGLPRGYHTVLGHEGLNFSSGQLQKVGLARALYRNPVLLLLDESTNAFDLKTEKLVLDRLKALPGTTLLFVSHRPSVMEQADHVLDLEQILKTP